MKQIFSIAIVFFLVSVKSFSQSSLPPSDSLNLKADDFPTDCSLCVETHTDKFTDKVSVRGKEVVKVKEGVNEIELLAMVTSSDAVAFEININKYLCVNEGNLVYFLLADGSKFSILQKGTFNCKGVFSLFMGGGLGYEKELKILATKKIQSIRCSGETTNEDFDLSNEEATKVRNLMYCLLKSKSKI